MKQRRRRRGEDRLARGRQLLGVEIEIQTEVANERIDVDLGFDRVAVETDARVLEQSGNETIHAVELVLQPVEVHLHLAWCLPLGEVVLEVFLDPFGQTPDAAQWCLQVM